MSVADPRQFPLNLNTITQLPAPFYRTVNAAAPDLSARKLRLRMGLSTDALRRTLLMVR